MRATASEEASQARKKADAGVQEWWRMARELWRQTKDASGAVWRDSRRKFEEAWNAFQDTWSEAASEAAS